MTDGSDAAKHQPEPRRVDGEGDDPVWKRFEALIAANTDAVEPTGTAEGEATVGSARTVEAKMRRSLSPPELFAEPRSQTGLRTSARSSFLQHRPWRHRVEGAAMMAALTLAAFAAGWLHGSLTAPPTGSLAETAAKAVGEAGADADSHFAAADAAMVAAIAAASPPYLVRLHVATGTAPRDVARLVTALTAWGFKAPQRIAAEEPVSIPEVRFHDEADREAARVLGVVAGRLLGEAALTPPEPLLGAGLDDALASLAGPADAASSKPAAPAEAAPSPRVLDLFVPAQ